MRYQRGSMIEALAAPFVRTARAKGLSEGAVIYRHALRNALIPTVTLVGLTLPTLVGGAYFIEYVFSLPGMGLLGIDSVFSRIQRSWASRCCQRSWWCWATCSPTCLYAVVDPRIRYE